MWGRSRRNRTHTLAFCTWVTRSSRSRARSDVRRCCSSNAECKTSVLVVCNEKSQKTQKMQQIKNAHQRFHRLFQFAAFAAFFSQLLTNSLFFRHFFFAKKNKKLNQNQQFQLSRNKIDWNARDAMQRQYRRFELRRVNFFDFFAKKSLKGKKYWRDVPTIAAVGKAANYFYFNNENLNFFFRFLSFVDVRGCL